MYNALLHLPWSTLWTHHSAWLLNGHGIAPLLYWWSLEGVVLKLSVLLFILATHLGEQANDNRSHEDEDDRDKYNFKGGFHETNIA